MTNPTLWNQLLVWPILNVLIVYYHLFTWLRLPGAMGFAIILLTATVRIILYPLMHQQLHSTQKMAMLKPKLDALNQKHKNDKTALQQAQLSLYKEHGINPAAGCLPMLIQFPILIALYNVFYSVLSNGNLSQMTNEINTILYSPALKITNLDMTFFGINLALKPSQWQTYGIWLLAIPVITGILQWVQTKLMMPNNNSKSSIVKSKSSEIQKKDKKIEEKSKEDTAAEMQKQMAIITPIMFGYFAYQFPLGLALYWNVFGIFGIIQQMRVQMLLQKQSYGTKTTRPNNH